MKNFNEMMIAVRTMLAIAILFTANIAVSAENKPDFNQLVLQAAMGNIQGHFTSQCPQWQLGMDSDTLAKYKECVNNEITQTIANDERESINSVANILINAGIILGHNVKITV